MERTTCSVEPMNDRSNQPPGRAVHHRNDADAMM